MQTLNLSSNHLSGSLPRSLASADKLETLLIRWNALDVLVPQIGQLSFLRELDLGHNNLHSIPSEMYLLSNLTWLSLEGNRNLTATLPSDFGSRFTNLQYLSISHTNFHSTIPLSFGRLKDLKQVRISDTAVTGQIPPSLAFLTRLEHIDLSANGYLHGSIPSFFGDFVPLSYCSLRKNRFDSSIPPTLGNLGEMKTLLLDGNELTGYV